METEKPTTRRNNEIFVIGIDAENPEKILVTYKSLNHTKDYPRETIFHRSLEDFVGFKEINGEKVKRFIKI